MLETESKQMRSWMITMVINIGEITQTRNCLHYIVFTAGNFTEGNLSSQFKYIIVYHIFCEIDLNVNFVLSTTSVMGSIHLQIFRQKGKTNVED